MNVQDSTGDAGFSFEAFQQAMPDAVAGLRALTKAAADAGLDKALTELMKIRVSQINGCAFCTQFHLNAARRMGMDGAKLDLVATWRDAPVFTPRERAALAWAEHVTAMGARPVPEAAEAELRAHFSHAETLHLTVAVATINAWNRIAGGLRFPPPPRQDG